MNELELVVDRKGLKLVIQNRNWCRVYLIKNDTMILLGANSLEKILSKLLIAFIPMKNIKSFIYLGVQMTTVLNLMEPHSVIAKKKSEDSELELVALNQEGSVLSLVKLSQNNITDWIEKLTIFMINYNKS